MRLTPIICGLLLLHGTVSFAITLPLTVETTTANEIQATQINFGKDLLLRFWGPTLDKSASERAYALIATLKQMAALGLTTKDVKVGIFDTQLQARIGEAVLFTITKKEIDSNKTPGPQLAKEWLVRLSQVFEAIPGYSYKSYSYQDPKASLPMTCLAVSQAIPQSAAKSLYRAIHASFPKGTKLRVINPKNYWSIVVEIGNKMILPPGADIALNPAAAHAIGLTDTIQPVILQEVSE